MPARWFTIPIVFNSEAAARRFGFPLGPTLERLAEIAVGAGGATSAFEAVGLSIPRLDNDGALPERPEDVPVGVVPLGFVARSSTDWFGVHVASSKDGTLSGGPVVVHLLKGCDHNDDLEAVLTNDLGYDEGEDVPRAEELVCHSVVARDLATYLSLVASLGFSDLCRHLTDREIAKRPGAADDPVIDRLLAIARVKRIAKPAALLEKAPKLKLAMPPKSAKAKSANGGKKSKAVDAKTAQAFFDARLKRPEGTLLKYTKLHTRNGGAAIELKPGAGGIGATIEVLETAAAETARAWNTEHPGSPVRSVTVLGRSKSWITI